MFSSCLEKYKCKYPGNATITKQSPPKTPNLVSVGAQVEWSVFNEVKQCTSWLVLGWVNATDEILDFEEDLVNATFDGRGGMRADISINSEHR